MRGWIGGAIAALWLLCAPTPALAQEFDSELLRAGSPGDNAFFTVQTATLPPPRTLTFGIRASISKDPLVALNSDNEERVGGVINKRAFTELAAALSFGSIEIWGALPLILYQRSDVMQDVVLPLRADKSGIGDLRVGVRYKFFQSSEGLALALATDLALPTHARAELSGDDGLGLSPRVVAEYTGIATSLAFNVGLRIRPEERLGDLKVGSAFVYGVAAGYELPLPLDPVFIVELAGEVGAGQEQEAPVEIRGGFRFHSDSLKTNFGIGYGHGLARGYGAPSHRGFVMASYTFGSPPPIDRPRDPKGADLDPDKDGITGTDDDCPNEAEDKDGHLDLDGCPDTDNDNDGVFDAKDACPDLPEDKDGHLDGDGCPDLDNDGDGLNDDVDDCPIKAEIINGVADDDGCPDNGKQSVFLEENRIRLDERITFNKGSANLSPKGSLLVAQISRVLVRNPDILRVQIQGHTDDRGSDSAQLLMSQRRAEVVREALVSLGVSEERIETNGFGKKKPVSSNATPDGRAKNERIDIVILEKKPAKPPEKNQGAHK